MNIKYLFAIFLALQVTNAFTIKPKPFQNVRVTTLPEEFENLMQTLTYVNNHASTKIQEGLESLTELSDGSLQYVKGIKENIDIQVEVCRQKAKEIGPEAVEHVEEESAKIDQVKNETIDKIVGIVANTRESLESKFYGVIEEASACVSQAENEWSACSGISCMIMVSKLGYQVADISSAFAYALPDVFHKIWIVAQVKLVALSDNSGRDMYKILTSLEEYINSQ